MSQLPYDEFDMTEGLLLHLAEQQAELEACGTLEMMDEPLSPLVEQRKEQKPVEQKPVEQRREAEASEARRAEVRPDVKRRKLPKTFGSHVSAQPASSASERTASASDRTASAIDTTKFPTKLRKLSAVIEIGSDCDQ